MLRSLGNYNKGNFQMYLKKFSLLNLSTLFAFGLTCTSAFAQWRNPPPPPSQCYGNLCVGDFVGVRLSWQSNSAAGAGTVAGFLSDGTVVTRGLDGRNYTFAYNDVASARLSSGGLYAGVYAGFRLDAGSARAAGFGKVIGIFPNGDVTTQGLDGHYYYFAQSNSADPARCAHTACPGNTIFVRNGGYGTLLGVLSDEGIVVRGVDGMYYSFDRGDY